MSKEDQKKYPLNPYGACIETTETDTTYQIDGQTIISTAGIRIVNSKGKKLIVKAQELLDILNIPKKHIDLFEEIKKKAQEGK